MSDAPGSLLVLRQLNNERAWRGELGPAWAVDEALSAEWTARERSPQPGGR